VKRWILSLVAVAIFASTAARGQEIPLDKPVMTTVRKGNVVPFDGTLLSPPAAAQIMARLNGEDERTALEVRRAVELEQASRALQVAKLEARAEYEREFHNAQLSVRDDQIRALKESQRPDDRAWWLTIGISGGLIVAIGAAFALSLAAN
jgi:hypothetical protein